MTPADVGAAFGQHVRGTRGHRLVVHDEQPQAGELQWARSAATALRGNRRRHAPVVRGSAGQRQRDDERRSAAFARAGGTDGAAVQLDEVLDDRQAEAQPAVQAGRRGVGLAEALEDVRQELRLMPIPVSLTLSRPVGVASLDATVTRRRPA